MQMVSQEEMNKLKQRLEDLRRAKVDVQDRINKAAGLGDLSENAEYHFAKEENRQIERDLKELETRMGQMAVVKNDDVPEDMVFLGHTVKLLDMDDDSEQLVRIVGEVDDTNADSDVMDVSSSSPMGEALVKAKVGDVVKVRAPAGTMEFKILAIV